MKEIGYNTNLAAEYYVLSVLYRLGLNAYLTLGNKKAIDIIIDFGNHLCTIDVKGLAGTTLWPMDNFSGEKQNHFVVLVSFLNKMKDISVAPECYIVPSTDVEKLMYRNLKKTRKGISRSTIRDKGKEFHDAWGLIK
jgi:hypothetical protein